MFRTERVASGATENVIDGAIYTVLLQMGKEKEKEYISTIGGVRLHIFSVIVFNVFLGVLVCHQC